jgi:hypothetical protein
MRPSVCTEAVWPSGGTPSSYGDIDSDHGRAGDPLYEGDGALIRERDRHRMGANALARNAAGPWEALKKTKEGKR